MVVNRSTQELQLSRRLPLKKIIIMFFLVIFGIIMMFPFVWTVLGSFKNLVEVSKYPPTFWPENPTFQNYRTVFQQMPFGRYYLNTAITSVAPTIITIFTATMAGYGFAKYDFTGKGLLFGLILSTMMIPYPATIVPLYVIVQRIGLIDTLWALIVVSLASAFGIFLMRQFCLTIPDDLLDAARIDGCSEFRIFTTIVIPLTKPALATLAIFAFSANWNSYIWPMLAINSRDLRTLAIAIPLFNGQFTQYPNLIYAASFMALIPIIVLYAFTQRYFTEGITMSGLKG